MEKEWSIYLSTAIIFYCSFSYGLTSYILGPALNEFRFRLNTDVEHLSLALGAIGLFYTVGALINGTLYSYLNRLIVLALLLLIGSIDLTLAPYCTQISHLYLMAVVAGFVSGGFDTAFLVWTCELWGSKSSIYLLGSQFFFAMGNFVSPLMSRPFLSHSTNQTSPTTNGTKHSRLEIPFSIVGITLLLASMLTVGAYFFLKVPSSQQQTTPKIDSPKTAKKSENRTRQCMLMISAIFMIAPYVGMEITNFQLVSTYSLNSYLRLNEQDSALSQSIMAGSFMVTRGLLTLLLIKQENFHQKTLLPIAYLVVTLANTFIILCDHFSCSKLVFWISQACLGFGFAPIFSTTYSYIEQHLPITDLVGGVFVCFSGTMIAVYCVTCGALLDAGYRLIVYWFNYATLASISLAFLLFTFQSH